jgi:hypothetical protein
MTSEGRRRPADETDAYAGGVMASMTLMMLMMLMVLMVSNSDFKF